MRLRFTIRDLLWLAVVVALAVGRWLEHRRMKPSYDIGESWQRTFREAPTVLPPSELPR